MIDDRCMANQKSSSWVIPVVGRFPYSPALQQGTPFLFELCSKLSEHALNNLFVILFPTNSCDFIAAVYIFFFFNFITKNMLIYKCGESCMQVQVLD